ncbi:unnamed protein product [Caenorhabditis auriculariae]|uniref:Uncharacterized protein n=1 Tax=Caenorhabditis auriculariae TaxID=2777116 RepID=A0A8S1HUM0_9PELO|nr:unnamed protein product [Caenorhabditis auriculariae]
MGSMRSSSGAHGSSGVSCASGGSPAGNFSLFAGPINRSADLLLTSLEATTPLLRQTVEYFRGVAASESHDESWPFSHVAPSFAEAVVASCGANVASTSPHRCCRRPEEWLCALASSQVQRPLPPLQPS